MPSTRISWGVALFAVAAAAGAVVFLGESRPSHAVAYEPQTELTLSQETLENLLLRARAAWDGDEAKLAASPPTEQALGVGNSLILTVFSADGRLVHTERVDDPATGLADKLARAVPAARSGSGGAADDAYLHLMVVSYTGRFPNFGLKGLFHNKVYEPRVTGLVYEWGGKRVELTPLEALYRNLNAKLSRQTLARRAGFDAKRISRLNALWMEIYRVIHVGEGLPDRRFVRFHRGHEVFDAKDVDTAAVHASLKLIGEWYRHNVVDGQVTYQFGPYTRRYLNHKRTMVRPTMAAWILNRLSVFLSDDELRRLGEETIRYYFQHFFQMDKSLAAGKILPSPEKTQKGEVVANRYTAGSFIASAVLERGEYERFRKEADLLMQWVMEQRREDGVFWTQFAHSQYFMPGQALLAVAYFFEQTKDPRYRDFFFETFEAYEGPLRSMMHLADQRYAPYAPAWFTQPFTKMWAQTKDERLRDLVFLINDRVVKWYDLNTRHKAYWDEDGILGPKYGFAGNNSITSASLESLVDAAWLARESGDHERFARYMRAIRPSIAYLMRLQYTPVNTYYVRDRDKVTGGFKMDLNNNLVWCDNVWHLASAFMKVHQWKLLDDTLTPR